MEIQEPFIKRPADIDFDWSDYGKGSVITADRYVEMMEEECIVAAEDEEIATISEVKEWFLEHNMHSFCLDW